MLTNNMSSNTSANYVVYDLRSYFSRQPGHLRLCPNCGENISVLNLSPSKLVTNFLAGATIPCHEFSVLYKCKACHWWAIRESWGDREGSDGPDCLIISGEKRARNISTNPEQDDSLWNFVLEDEHIYDKVLPLPNNLGRLFTENRNNT